MITLTSAHPEMVDFGSEQGMSVFETAVIVNYFVADAMIASLYF